MVGWTSSVDRSAGATQRTCVVSVLVRTTAHVTYDHDYVIPLIGDLLGGTIDLSSNATFRLEAEPTAFC